MQTPVDEEDLRDLPCGAVVDYLDQHGWAWTRLERNAADHVIWAARDDDMRIVWVPTNRAAWDYGHRMLRVIAVLESWEGRDRELIVREIFEIGTAALPK